MNGLFSDETRVNTNYNGVRAIVFLLKILNNSLNVVVFINLPLKWIYFKIMFNMKEGFICL